MFQQIRGRVGHLDFLFGPKKTIILVENIKALLPVKFRWILFSSFREEVANVTANQRLRRPSCFADRPEKQKLDRGHWDLAVCPGSLHFRSAVSDEKSKCLNQSKAGWPLCFSDRTEKCKLVEDVEVFLPVKCSWIPLSRFRENVQHISDKQRLGRPSCFSDRSEKHKFGRGRWDLASC